MARVLKEYPQIAIKPESLDDRLDFGAIFGRDSKVHFEIGSGRGTFLVNEALAKPDEDFFGVEWCSKIYRYAMDRIGRWGVSNVRIIRTDAAWLIKEHVADETISCFHIYFPDPWPKKRHNRRRFVNEENLEQMLRCLKKGGMIKLATDHADYFEQMQRVLDHPAVEKVEFFKTSGAQGQGEWAGTNFERKYLAQGREIYTLAGTKK